MVSSLSESYERFWVEDMFDIERSVILRSVSLERCWQLMLLLCVLDAPRAYPYWEGYTNPPLTLDIVRLIPKADLNVRLGERRKRGREA